MNNLTDKLRISFPSVNFNRINNVFIHIENRQQIIILKNKADISAAKDRQLFILHFQEFFSSNNNAAGGRTV